MKRYNQGFAKFGPMEQCDDGEWVKYEDVIETSDKWNKYSEELNCDRIDWMMKAYEYQVIAGCFGITTVILFGILLAIKYGIV